ncbi:MAG TPA: DUF3618 domain-containing protein [Pyrinomonadaceae bacterium]|nr:DUF3618 domain-containing protein [Pyrinomonadaceae bacterium]
MGEATNKINTGEWDDRVTSTRDDDVYIASESSDFDENPEQLRAEIEDTRAEMSQTINEIQERLSPEHLMGQVKETVREATVGKVERVMQRAGETISEVAEPAWDAMGRAGTAIKDTGVSVGNSMWKNPVPVALIGLGLGMLVMRQFRGNGGDYGTRHRTPRKQQYYGSDEMQYGENTGATTGTRMNTGTSTGSNALNQVKETASDLANRSTTALNNLSTKAKDSASTVGKRFGEVLRDNPLAVGAVAVAAGTAVGLALPSTRFENEYVGEASEKLVDKAQEVAREAIDKVQSAAQQMTQEGQPRA